MSTSYVQTKIFFFLSFMSIRYSMTSLNIKPKPLGGLIHPGIWFELNSAPCKV